MFKRKFWFTGIAAVFFLTLSGFNTVRADIPSWFWNTLFTWAASVTDEVDALEAEVVAQQAQIVVLEAQLDAEVVALELLAQNALGTAVAAQNDVTYALAVIGSLAAQLDAEVVALEAQVDALALQTVDDIASYLEVDTSIPSKPVVRIVGANFQVVNGLGNTSTENGVGNLIVGYDEAATDGVEFCSDGQWELGSSCLSANETWGNNQKSGSHYIVGGPQNSYTQSGGLIVGYRNVSNGWGASVIGGRDNKASGYRSSVSGGRNSTASGDSSSVSGGEDNVASGQQSSVSGGRTNTASGDYASVSGGFDNTAAGDDSSVSGGQDNRASALGVRSSVSGGIHNVAAGDYSSVSGGAWNSAGGDSSSISGGSFGGIIGEFDWSAGTLWEDD
jgi:hypothetical protein